MPDYIDREALLNNRPEYLNTGMDDEWLNDIHAGWNMCNKEYYDLIKNMPTIDVVEQKHGHWEMSVDPDGAMPYCSNCLGTPRSATKEKYCPNCGAKMDVIVE